MFECLIIECIDVWGFCDLDHSSQVDILCCYGCYINIIVIMTISVDLIVNIILKIFFPKRFVHKYNPFNRPLFLLTFSTIKV